MRRSGLAALFYQSRHGEAFVAWRGLRQGFSGGGGLIAGLGAHFSDVSGLLRAVPDPCSAFQTDFSKVEKTRIVNSDCFQSPFRDFSSSAPSRPTKRALAAGSWWASYPRSGARSALAALRLSVAVAGSSWPCAHASSVPFSALRRRFSVSV